MAGDPNRASFTVCLFSRCNVYAHFGLSLWKIIEIINLTTRRETTNLHPLQWNGIICPDSALFPVSIQSYFSTFQYISNPDVHQYIRTVTAPADEIHTRNPFLSMIKNLFGVEILKSPTFLLLTTSSIVTMIGEYESNSRSLFLISNECSIL